MRGDGDVGGISDDFVGDAPFAVGILAGEVERARVDLNCFIGLCETAAKVFEMGPVWNTLDLREEKGRTISIESISNL